MQILYILIGIAGAVGLLSIISETVRDFVVYTAYTIGNFIFGNFWIAVIAIIFLFIVLPILYVGGWVAIWAYIGGISMSPVAGMVIGIGTIISLFCFRWLLKPAIVIAGIAIFVGLCFPIVKGALNRHTDARQAQIADELDRETLKINPQGFSPAKVLEDSFLYDNYGRPTPVMIKKGDEVRTLSLIPKRFGKKSEFFISITISNDLKDYTGDGTTEGYVPKRKLDLGNEEESFKKISKEILKLEKPKELLGLNPPPAIETESTMVLVETVPVEKSVCPTSLLKSLVESGYAIEFNPTSGGKDAYFTIEKEGAPITKRFVRNKSLFLGKGEKASSVWTNGSANVSIYSIPKKAAPKKPGLMVVSPPTMTKKLTIVKEDDPVKLGKSLPRGFYEIKPYNNNLFLHFLEPSGNHVKEKLSSHFFIDSSALGGYAISGQKGDYTLCKLGGT